MTTHDSEKRLIDLSSAWASWYRETSAQMCTDGSENDGGFDDNLDGWHDGRQAAYLLGKFLAVRCWSDRLGLDSGEIDGKIRRILAFVRRRQAPDGRMDLGGHYTPNEVGFTLPALGEGYRRIIALPGNPLEDVAASLKEYLLLGAEAVVQGDAFTANHRWAAAAGPLAVIHSLWPDDRYLRKIEGYLADGFDLNEDGSWYEEKSPNYNMVANQGVLLLADYLHRPELIDLVRQNLDFSILFLQPNGEADSSFSHRQDRGTANCKAVSFRQARRIALHTGEDRFAALAQFAWDQGDRGTGEGMPLLFDLDNYPGELPVAQPLPVHFERNLPASGLARIRNGKTALTLACDSGNHFYDSVLQSWGGPRLSDDWFHLHRGDLVLQTIHLSGAGTGSIQPKVMRQIGAGHYHLDGGSAGWDHTLHFRPGWPKLFMRTDYKHEIDVQMGENEIDLSLQSTAKSALMASLGFWIRPGAEVFEGDQLLGMTEGGKKIALKGGLPVTIKQGESELKITGLPLAKHRRLLEGTPSIPSGIASKCSVLFLGLTFPVELQIHLQII